MTKKESVKIDDLCRNGPIPIEQLRSHMIEFVKLNNRRLLSLRRMMPNIDGQHIHYVVLFIIDPKDCKSAELPVYAAIPRGKPYIWCDRLPRVMYDYDLQIGFPIGHFFVSTLKRFVAPAMLSLMALYLKGRGLIQKKIPHLGSFVSCRRGHGEVMMIRRDGSVMIFQVWCDVEIESKSVRCAEKI